ncbi:MAG: DUF512 domain-containing protein [Clostridia bacterium]
MSIVNKVLIFDIKKDSIADKLKIKKGDYILSINNEEFIDILDYKFNTADLYVSLEVEHKDGKIQKYEINKEYDEDIGIIFETELIDKPKNCNNKCIFCFMEQLPENVRDTLVFKDDDYRLSFFSGNYITLTNMKQKDIDRIIKYRMSPINISIHATDKKVRSMMLNNKHAGEVLKYLDDLYNAGININTQIVLCKGINDGKILEKTIKDLSRYAPVLKSICIVPVGLSKNREGLYPLEVLNSKDCKNTINIISNYQKQFRKKYKKSLVYLADEFYLKARAKIPKYKRYDDFDQLEDGIGMIAVFEHDFKNEMKILKKKILNKKVSKNIKRKVTLITGKITEDYISSKARQVTKLLPDLKINIIAPINTYFGENITVTGLVTATDIIKTLKEYKKEKTDDLVEYIVIPQVMLKEDEDIFLDDTTLKEVQTNLKTKIIISDGSAKDFINALVLQLPKENIYKLNNNVKIQSYENSIK